MFDKEFISKLGKKSISQNVVLTKQRASEAWNKASKNKQREILELAGVPYNTAYRVRSTGIITVKMTIAFSQVLNLDPYYLIGVSDDNAGYSFASAKKLLSEHKYARAVKEFERAHPPVKKQEPVSEKSQAAVETDVVVPEEPRELSAKAAVQKLTEDDMITLFKGLIIKAGTGKPQAIADVTKITEILLF